MAILLVVLILGFHSAMLTNSVPDMISRVGVAEFKSAGTVGRPPSFSAVFASPCRPLIKGRPLLPLIKNEALLPPI